VALCENDDRSVGEADGEIGMLLDDPARDPDVAPAMGATV
jgi:hypothetical protein